MKSDLAKAVHGFPLPDQDDAFLVTHLLAGVHELAELEAAIAALTARRDEAAAVKSAIESTLQLRHVDGRNFVALGSLVRVARAGRNRAPIAIEPAETLTIAE